MIDNVIKEVLSKFKTVAVVGLSRDPQKASYQVPEYLKEHGFHIIPVNPFVDIVLGEKSYKSLLDMPVEVQRTIEIVEIFRPSGDVLPIVEQAIQLRKSLGVPYVVWMQLGIMNETAAEKAKKAGLIVVMNHCMMLEHKRIFKE